MAVVEDSIHTFILLIKGSSYTWFTCCHITKRAGKRPRREEKKKGKREGRDSKEVQEFSRLTPRRFPTRFTMKDNGFKKKPHDV